MITPFSKQISASDNTISYENETDSGIIIFIDIATLEYTGTASGGDRLISLSVHSAAGVLYTQPCEAVQPQGVAIYAYHFAIGAVQQFTFDLNNHITQRITPITLLPGYSIEFVDENDADSGNDSCILRLMGFQQPQGTLK